jgi:hypothetical protein
MRLVDRHVLRLTEDRGGGGKDEAGDAMRAHPVQQHLGRTDVVAVVLRRLGHRFADLDEAGEMHHRGRLDRAQHGIHEGCIADVADMQVRAGHGLAAAAGQIVRDHGVHARLAQPLDHVRADVAGAADDEDGIGHVDEE